jgi:uncharacterized protein YdeI (BOF family)
MRLFKIILAFGFITMFISPVVFADENKNKSSNIWKFRGNSVLFNSVVEQTEPLGITICLIKGSGYAFSQGSGYYDVDIHAGSCSTLMVKPGNMVKVGGCGGCEGTYQIIPSKVYMDIPKEMKRDLR